MTENPIFRELKAMAWKDPIAQLAAEYGETFNISKTALPGGGMAICIWRDNRKEWNFQINLHEFMHRNPPGSMSIHKWLEGRLLRGIEEYFAWNNIHPVSDRPHEFHKDDYLWRCWHCGGVSTHFKYERVGTEYKTFLREECKCCNAPRKEDGIIKPKKNERLVKVSHTDSRYEYASAAYSGVLTYHAATDFYEMKQELGHKLLPVVRGAAERLHGFLRKPETSTDKVWF
jgi:hypothetical protein